MDEIIVMFIGIIMGVWVGRLLYDYLETNKSKK